MFLTAPMVFTGLLSAILTLKSRNMFVATFSTLSSSRSGQLDCCGLQVLGFLILCVVEMVKGDSAMARSAYLRVVSWDSWRLTML